MATDLRNLPAFLSNDADFRAWGSGIAAQLAAVGLTQASDTGQINWASVARPATSSYGGYEIWRFADSLQATKPVFIKIEYGVGSVADRPALRTTVSTATNGAGTPTGQVGTIRTHAVGGSKTAGATLASYCSGSSSRLNLCTNLDPSLSTFAIVLFVERTKNASGTDTGDGIVAHSQLSSTGVFQVIPASGTVPASQTTSCTLPVPYSGLSVLGADVALAPTIAWLGKALFATWCGYSHIDLGELGTFTMTHLGASHTYMPLGDGLHTNPTNVLSQTGMSLAMLWE